MCCKGFIEKPEITTNCKLYAYRNTYYNYELDEKISMNNKSKRYREDALGIGII